MHLFLPMKVVYIHLLHSLIATMRWACAVASSSTISRCMLVSWRFSLKMNISGALVFSSWFVGLDLSSEPMSISYVLHVPLVTVGISVRIAALDITVSISLFLSGLFEVSRMMIASNNVISVVVGNWLGLVQYI